MITYKMKNGDIQVFLDGKRIGAIRHVANGYHYKPINSAPGATFETIAQVKKDIEG